jgi:hypothetical protein
MLAAWSSQPQAIYAPTLVEKTLVAGTAAYTWGTAGDINSARPVSVERAYVRVNDTDYPVEVRDIEEYAHVSNKGYEGIPERVYIRHGYPLATAYFYPVPQEAYAFKAETLQPFSTYAAADDLGLPTEFSDPITYQLAVRIGPEFSSVPSDVAALAGMMLDALKRQYAQPVPVVQTNPIGNFRRYSIYED